MAPMNNNTILDIVYLTEDISTDDLVQRLKDCAQAFQDMSQDDDNSAYLPLALHLASETFLEHPSKEVRILVACCIADVFRVYNVDYPYKDLTQLKVIFEFFVNQLRGLEGPTEEPFFTRCCYLLENFSRVQTWKICLKLEDSQEILCRLLKLMFEIYNENENLKSLILDILSPLIDEADYALQERLIDLILQTDESLETENKQGYNTLANSIVKSNGPSFSTYIHQSNENRKKFENYHNRLRKKRAEIKEELEKWENKERELIMRASVLDEELKLLEAKKKERQIVIALIMAIVQEINLRLKEHVTLH